MDADDVLSTTGIDVVLLPAVLKTVVEGVDPKVVLSSDGEDV